MSEKWGVRRSEVPREKGLREKERGWKSVPKRKWSRGCQDPPAKHPIPPFPEAPGQLTLF